MVEGLEGILAGAFAVGLCNRKRRSGAGHFAVLRLFGEQSVITSRTLAQFGVSFELS